MACNHTIHKHNHHFGWDNSIDPILTVTPGQTIDIETIDSSGGQLGPDSSVDDLGTLSFDKVNPVTGPVFIEGAEPGDAVAITFLDFKPSGWGWTANIPGFGLLTDQFPDAALHIWKYDSASMAPALYGPGGQVRLSRLWVPLVWLWQSPATIRWYHLGALAATSTFAITRLAQRCTCRLK